VRRASPPVIRDVAVARRVLLRVVPFDMAFLRFRREVEEDTLSLFLSLSSSTDDEEEVEDRTDGDDE